MRGISNVALRGGRIETVAPRLLAAGERFDGVLINPMRRSLGEATMRALSALCAGPLVYLGPAPRAAAEDLRVLAGSGWQLATVRGADLHPGTAAVMLCTRWLPPTQGAAQMPSPSPSGSEQTRPGSQVVCEPTASQTSPSAEKAPSGLRALKR